MLGLGCEPLAAAIVAIGRSVPGVDASGPLRALARMPGHAFVEADMRGLDLGRTFGGVLARDSPCHLTAEDQRAMFPVFARHAAPGAPLVFKSGPDASERIGRLAGAPPFHASLGPAAYRALPSTHGFEVVDVRPDDPECDFHAVWRARRRPLRRAPARAEPTGGAGAAGLSSRARRG